MSEKLAFSPYPPQGRRHAHAAPVRRSRRRLLPYLFIGILALIYLSHTRRSIIEENKYMDETQHDHTGEEQVAQNDPSPLLHHTESLGLHDAPTELPQIVHDPVPLDDTRFNPTKLSSLRASSTVAAVPTVVSEDEVKSGSSSYAKEAAEDETEDIEETKGKNKVALEAHIMSKCPDAQDCLRLMVVPAMEKIHDLVNFNLSFVQTVKDDGSVECRHGPGECLGDQLILCAQNIYSNSSVRYLGFANCLIADYQRIPQRSHVEECALEHSVDFEKLNECASDSKRGPQLLKDSAQWTKDEGVKYSCTVRVNRENWCVRDGGQWKDCDSGSEVEDLVGKIKKLAAHES